MMTLDQVEHAALFLLLGGLISYLGKWLIQSQRESRENTKEHGALREEAVDRYVLRREWARCEQGHRESLERIEKRLEGWEEKNENAHLQLFSRLEELKQMISTNGLRRWNDPPSFDSGQVRCHNGKREGE